MLSEAPTRVEQPSDLASLTPSELEDELAELVAHINAGMCRWLELVAEFEGRGTWIGTGSCSYPQWLARSLTASQLEKAVRAYRRVSAGEAAETHEREYVVHDWDEADGSLHLRARLAPEDGALFLRALEASRDALWDRERATSRGSAEPRQPVRRPRA
jgi:hypothetical protein